MAYSGFIAGTPITAAMLNAANEATTYNAQSGNSLDMYLRSGAYIIARGGYSSYMGYSCYAYVQIYRYTNKSTNTRTLVREIQSTSSTTVYIDNIGGEGWYYIKTNMNMTSYYDSNSHQSGTLTAVSTATVYKAIGTAVRGQYIVKFNSPTQGGRSAGTPLTASVLNSGLCGTLSSL